MYSNTSIKEKMSKRFYYGWMIVFISALGVFFSGPGQTYSISVFINSYIKDFSWSRSTVSSIYSAATLLSGLLLFLMGRLIDKYGQKRMGIIIAFSLGIACIWNSFIIGPVMLFIGFFMIRFFGQGSMIMVPNTLVPQWFVKKRALALSIMSLGGFIASAVIPPLNTWIIYTWGWQTAWRLWALLLWLIFIPLVLKFVHNKPEDIGLLPDNAAKKSMEEMEKEKQILDRESWTVKEAMKSRTFWFMLFCATIPAMINTGLIFHLVSILGEKGLSPTVSSYILSLMAIVSFPLTFLAGYILDRVKVHYILALTFVLEFISLIMILYIHSSTLAVIFGITIGIFNAFSRVSQGVLWPNYFGRKHLGSIKGFAMTITVIGSAFGPLPFGFAFDIFGSYSQIIKIMMLFPILGIIASLLSPKPVKEK